MAKTLGRPRKVAACAPTSALVPAELIKKALREVAATPVEEMTIARFIEDAAEELDSAFSGDRTKTEISRKLIPILAKTGWQGQEADISAMLDAYEAQQAVRNVAPNSLSAEKSGMAKAARRSADSDSTLRDDAPGTAGKVASVSQPRLVEDGDGYETFGDAEDQARLDSKVPDAQLIPVPTDGTANASSASPNSGNGTQDQGGTPGPALANPRTPIDGSFARQVAAGAPGRSNAPGNVSSSRENVPAVQTTSADNVTNEPLARSAEQSKMAVSGVALVTSIPPNSGAPSGAVSPLSGGARDRQPLNGTTTPNLIQKPAHGMFDLRPAESHPKPNIADGAAQQQTQAPKLPAR